ncbi:pulmonary surfactant-associated protein A-like [Leptodactylus fuscus]|uniref:pulmonary surfactant-associated protein A-like n=1 Tax=Leptodactylus fuscus TaxID=238119 RepID=UPI003F4EF908
MIVSSPRFRCLQDSLQLPKMFRQGSFVLTLVVGMVACLPQPQNLPKSPEVAAIPKPNAKAPQGIVKKIGVKVNNPASLQDLERRISKLEAVMKLEGRIKVVGNKMIATSGKEMDFAASNSTCSGVGGQIVAPMNEAENAAVLHFVKIFNRYPYIGLREGVVPGKFNYMNGAPAVYTRWNKGEPSGKGTEGCVEMYTDGQWNDKACNQNRLTICEL